MPITNQLTISDDIEVEWLASPQIACQIEARIRTVPQAHRNPGYSNNLPRMFYYELMVIIEKYRAFPGEENTVQSLKATPWLTIIKQPDAICTRLLF
jgi:hypothetical protein